MTFADEFPELNRRGGERLVGEWIGSKSDGLTDGLVISWFRRQGCHSLDEVLAISPETVVSWRGIGVGKLARIRDLLGRLEASAAAEVPASIAAPAEDLGAAPQQSIATKGPGSEGTNEGFVGFDEGWDRPKELLELLDEYPIVDDRELDVFVRRTLGVETPTLDELGQVYGVTRERIRQIETKVCKHLARAYAEDAEWSALRQMGKDLTGFLGGCAPVEAVAEFAVGQEATSQLTCDFLLWAEGYRRAGDLLEAPRFEAPSEVPFLDPNDLFVETSALVDGLLAQGVHMRHLRGVLKRLGDLEWIDGVLVRRPRSVTDAAIIRLTLREEVMDLNELHRLAAPDKNLKGFRNRVLEDDRFTRVTLDSVALAEWDMPAYTGITSLMQQELADGPRVLDELAAELNARYGVSPASVRMYAAAPAFKVEGRTVALRSSADPYRPKWRPDKVPGFFRTPRNGVCWAVRVDKDVMRGSGRSAPTEAAVHLGLGVGDELSLDIMGAQVPLIWSATSPSGPRIGSLRSVAEALDASEGQLLVLEIEAAETGRAPEVGCRIVAFPEGPSRMVAEEGLTAVTGNADWSVPARALRDAMFDSAQDLERLLERRGDVDILRLYRVLVNE